MMGQTSLDYDKIIWEVFAIGIIPSVLILYYFHNGGIPNGWGIWALTLGFSILVYSFFLIFGYGFKRGKLEGVIRNGYRNNNNILVQVNEEDNLIQRELGRVLNNNFYLRVRWIGEIILGLIGVYYFVSFYPNLDIPIIIILIALVLCCIANCRALRNQR